MANLKKIVLGGKEYGLGHSDEEIKAIVKGMNIVEGAQKNVLEGVKVNGTALTIANKMVDVLVATGSANGNIAVNGVDVPVKGLAALAYKAKVSATELDAALKTVIDGHGTAIDTLNGTGAGSVKKAVDDAINKFATDVTDDDVVNSYKELIDWVAAHGSEAGEMAKAITAMQGVLDGFGGEGEPSTVSGELAKKVDKEGYIAYSQKEKDKLGSISNKANNVTFSVDEATETLTVTVA